MINQKKDIFDRIMSLKIFVPIYPFYKKNKEILLYLMFGAITTVISIASFWLLCDLLLINELVSNLISWILAVFVAFITNRIWVFDAATEDRVSFWKQFFKFYGGRVVTLVIEEAIILLFITVLQFNAMVVKIAAQIVVIVLNYVISKLFIFKKDKK